MALKIVQPKTQVEVSPVIEPVVLPVKVFVQPESDIQLLTMEYLDLWKKYEYFEVKGLMKRMDELRKQLLSIANETMDESQPAVFSCPKGEMVFSERGKTTEVPDPLGLIQELLDKFGPDVTASVVDVALTPLRKIMSDFELKPYLKEKLGSRTLRAVRLSS